MTELLALLDGREVGTVRQERGRLNFVYSDALNRPWFVGGCLV